MEVVSSVYWGVNIGVSYGVGIGVFDELVCGVVYEVCEGVEFKVGGKVVSINMLRIKSILILMKINIDMLT